MFISFPATSPRRESRAWIFLFAFVFVFLAFTLKRQRSIRRSASRISGGYASCDLPANFRVFEQVLRGAQNGHR
jgi:hypothetical protein